MGSGTRILPVVKADAYGIGVERALAVFDRVDPWGYGVATVAEGLELRRLGVTRPVLVLMPAESEAVRDAVERGLTLSVSSLDALEEISQEADAQDRGLAVHVEVDTGMGRAGFDWRRAAEWGPRIAALTTRRVRWEGLYTHFHSADEADSGPTELQRRRFRDTVEALPDADGTERLLHLSNSAGILRRVDLEADLARPGIFLYGGSAGRDLPEPEEVVAVRARILLVREVPAGTTLGYGATYRAARAERWATLGIGYGDGVPRALGNQGSVVVRGRMAPIIGRISMDLTVVDITDLPEVGRGEVVTLIGTDGGARVSLEEFAEHAGTNNYEILTGLGTRLPRIWSSDGHSQE